MNKKKFNTKKMVQLAILIAIIMLSTPSCSSTSLNPLLVILVFSPVMIRPIPLLTRVVVVTVFAKFLIHIVFRYGIFSVSLGDVIVITTGFTFAFGCYFL